MASDTSLVFNLIARDRLSPQLQQAQGRFGRLRDSIKGLVGPALAFGAINMLGGFVNDARESAKVAAITEQRIKSTGGAARLTADDVGNLATAISNKTGADDEAIQSGANLLLTFTNIRNEAGKGNDIFNQATMAATDMAAAMNNGEVTAEGLKTANIQLGKALNDPIKGIGALSKVGVSFTEQQKEQIKTLVKSGDTMGAQKIILGELKKEFGGTAEAAATPMEKLRTTMGNLGETIGAVLLPYVDKFVTKLTGVISFVQANSSWLIPLVGGLTALGTTIFIIVKAIQAWTAVQAALNVVMAMNPIGLIIIGVAALIAAIVLIATKTRWFQNIWNAVWGFVKNLFSTVVNWIGSKISWLVGKYQWLRDKVRGFFTAIGQWVISKISAAWNFVSSKISWLVGRFSSMKNSIVNAASSAASWIRSKFGGAVDWVRGKFNSFVSFIRGLPGRLSSALSGAFNGLKSAFRSAINWVISKWNGLHFTLPSVTIFGKKLGGGTIGTPNLPYLAKGGVASGSGAAIVGEKGPEMLDMPKGARVTPLSRVGGAGGPAQVTIKFEKSGDPVLDTLLDVMRDKIRVQYGGNVQSALGR